MIAAAVGGMALLSSAVTLGSVGLGGVGAAGKSLGGPNSRTFSDEDEIKAFYELAKRVNFDHDCVMDEICREITPEYEEEHKDDFFKGIVIQTCKDRINKNASKCNIQAKVDEDDAEGERS